MMFLGTIGKRFGDAGLKDILVQSGVLAEGSADKALKGSMYNRTVRCFKLTYEVLNRLLLKKAKNWFEECSTRKGVLEKAVYDVRSLANDLFQDTFNKVIHRRMSY